MFGGDAVTPSGLTLGALLESLGEKTVRALVLPRGLEVPIGAPTIFDPADTQGMQPDAVVLVPGRPNVELVVCAAGRGVAALVIRTREPDPGIMAEAESCGIAVLLCEEAIPWGQLYTLIDELQAISGSGPLYDGAADLFSLANDIALRAGGAVAIEDLSMQVLAYSTIPGQQVDDQRRDGILGRQVPAHPGNVEEYDTVLRSETAVWSVKPAEYRPRLAIAIRDGGQALGSIWVVEGDVPLARDAPEALAEGALVAASNLARMNLAADIERRTQTERLDRLLRGASPMQQAEESFGLKPADRCTVVALSRSRGSSDQPYGFSDESAAAYVSDMLRRELTAYRIQAAVGAFDGQAIGVIGATADAQLLERIATAVLTRADELVGGPWRAGFSRTLSGLSEVPAGVQQARQALGVVHGPLGRGAIGRNDELAASVFLLDLFESMKFRPTFAAEPLWLVLDHDLRYGTEYARTLRAWTANQYDVPRAAEVLRVHPNTLRHRLRRLGEVIDLDDADVRLALAVQLRLQEIGTKHVGRTSA
ncbi:PucR family transcriptional regulator [Agromyces italicus]|uniref:PucR family transcriptional regulator n=1 Tax=Agromyces italicus TaxID=279572 RepID=UPI0003B71A65|nr:PucR family transcriptional regulator [Agromyces italicus]